MINWQVYNVLTAALEQKKVTLVAVSKLKPASDILELYNAGQRDFGENYVQELTAKAGELPADIKWHFIGHLQSNKVKYIAPFVHLIHSVDSESLLAEINRQGAKSGRVIRVLLQLYIATEETKFGMDIEEARTCISYLKSNPDRGRFVAVCGVMGMASNTTDTEKVRSEFMALKSTFDTLKGEFFADNDDFGIISMGMSGDYAMAVEAGANMVRIGSTIFGSRNPATT